MSDPRPIPANHPPLAVGEAHIWAVALDPPAMHLDSRTELLSPEELERAADFRLAAPRERFVMARAALRILLGRYLEIGPAEIKIAIDSNNKPRLADAQLASDLRFNVAHSDQLALIAVTHTCEIGVDVERLREVRHAQHIAKRYFHPAEIAAIAAAPPASRDAAFLRCWTGKEAVLKALGSGITGSLAGFHVPATADREDSLLIDVPTRSQQQPAQCWLQRVDPDNDYLAAVAVVSVRLNARCMGFAW